MKKFRVFYISLIVVISIFFLYSWGYLNPLENALLAALKPFGTMLTSTANRSKGVVGWAKDLKSIQKENKSLREQVNRAEAEIASLQEAKKENDSLRKDLDFKVNSG